MLQRIVLFSGTIKDNLRWGDENATDEEIRHACQLAQADDFIQTFPKGYDTYIEQGARMSPAARSSASASRVRC